MKVHWKGEFLAALRKDLALIPGMAVTIGQSISHRIDHMLSGTRANIAVKVFGDDLAELRRLAGQVRIQHLVEHEAVVDARTAVLRGAMERLSPILMTALATGLGLIPIALAHGQAGSEIQAPMAIVILTGLVTSTVLNMLVVPALYLRFGSVRTLSRPRDDKRSEAVEALG
jgi:Cu/Ag efflux pump CusA